MEKEKPKTKTSSSVKNRYNKKTYREYRFTVRKDSVLYDVIEEYKQDHPQDFSNLIKELLTKHFELN